MDYEASLFNPETDIEVFGLKCIPTTDPEKEAVLVSPGFKGTISAKKRYKIYVALNEAGVHYVGCTCTTMSSRLSLGNRSRTEGKKGYHGYKWLHHEGLQLLVFHLPGLVHPAKNKVDKDLNKLVAERVEAELVYAVRTATGQWPLSQHEIHFHNLSTTPALAKLTTKIAQLMYQSLAQQITPTTPHGYPHQYTNPSL